MVPGVAPKALLVAGAPNAPVVGRAAVFPNRPPLVAGAAGCDPNPPKPPVVGAVVVEPKADDPKPPPVDVAPNAEGWLVPKPPVEPKVELVAGCEPKPPKAPVPPVVAPGAGAFCVAAA